MGDESELPEGAGNDSWAAHLPGQELVPAYLTSRFAAQYRVIVDVLVAEQDSSLTGLSYDDVANGVRAHLRERLDPAVCDRLLDDIHFDNRLEQLERWKIVTRWQQPARTGEDFLRRRDRYQLTPLAANLHTFWAAIGEADDDAGDLTLAPRAIHERLVALEQALHTDDYSKAATEFQVVSTLHQAMAKAARTWQRTLAHALSGSPDPAKQELLWTTLQAYVRAWGEQVDVHSPAIADAIDRLANELTDSGWAVIVRTSMADDADNDIVLAGVRRARHTWEALGAWFRGPDAQAKRLRRQLRDLVAPWARNMSILMDTGGAITRKAELLGLATAVERAPDDETAWRIWDTAVGVFSARHLLLPAAAADEHAVPWHVAPPAPVTARFREQGTRAAVGRRAQTPNYGAGKDAARRERAAALAIRREAEATLRQRSGTRLASWQEVSDAELSLLLELVGTARRGTASPQGWESTTADGRWRVRLAAPASAEDTASIRSPGGTLVTADWLFAMEPA
ncbi:DUF2397 domain-containing protein [Prauserella flavalba]|uniref:TIGR02677 family protein n=1 Tax=Prauserella flavalba TaxID=1477506 RepID=A0A318M1K1_9PSEU|nr:DUF2397 domain-containing protein [Prauserella flavalba]PXY23937.1 hypothetical protein BA062_27070 [Prauserella flavalba]